MPILMNIFQSVTFFSDFSHFLFFSFSSFLPEFIFWSTVILKSLVRSYAKDHWFEANAFFFPLLPLMLGQGHKSLNVIIFNTLMLSVNCSKAEFTYTDSANPQTTQWHRHIKSCCRKAGPSRAQNWALV